MPPRYIAVRDGSTYATATVHADRDCPDGPVRAAPDNLDGEPCPECTDAVEAEPETCDVVLTSGDREGEVCGRDRPCRFHD